MMQTERGGIELEDRPVDSTPVQDQNKGLKSPSLITNSPDDWNLKIYFGLPEWAEVWGKCSC